LSDPEQSRVRPEPVGISAIPVSREGNESFSGLGGWNLLVNAGSEDKMDRIWPFIEYMSAPEQQRLWAISGSYLPTLKDLYDDAEVLEKVPVARLGARRSRTPAPGPSRPTTRTCRWRWPGSSTPP
jgi:multiple sugar transport system substrate-binding protein